MRRIAEQCFYNSLNSIDYFTLTEIYRERITTQHNQIMDYQEQT